MPDNFLSVVVPVYRAEEMLDELLKRLDKALRELTSRYEMILVEDRSPDKSWEEIQNLCKRYPNLIGIRLSRNFGQDKAISAGLQYATGDWLFVMDCDLQDRPEDLGMLLAKAREGYDIVLARRKRRKHSLIKRLTSRIFYMLFNLLAGLKIDPEVGSFRLMKRKVALNFNSMEERARMLAPMMEWLGFHVGYCDVSHAKRHQGKSSYNLKKLMGLALDGMFSFTNRPLHLAIVLGLSFAFSAGLYGLVYLMRYFFMGGIGVSGWLSTVLLLSFLNGIVLITVGVSGLYIGRIYDQVKGRPLYVIDEVDTGSSVDPKHGIQLFHSR